VIAYRKHVAKADAIRTGEQRQDRPCPRRQPYANVTRGLVIPPPHNAADIITRLAIGKAAPCNRAAAGALYRTHLRLDIWAKTQNRRAWQNSQAVALPGWPRQRMCDALHSFAVRLDKFHQVMRPTCFGAGAGKTLPAKGLRADNCANLVAVHIDIARLDQIDHLLHTVCTRSSMRLCSPNVSP